MFSRFELRVSACLSFPAQVISVHEDELATIIAYSLASEEYHKKLQKFFSDDGDDPDLDFNDAGKLDQADITIAKTGKGSTAGGLSRGIIADGGEPRGALGDESDLRGHDTPHADPWTNTGEPVAVAAAAAVTVASSTGGKEKSGRKMFAGKLFRGAGGAGGGAEGANTGGDGGAEAMSVATAFGPSSDDADEHAPDYFGAGTDLFSIRLDSLIAGLLWAYICTISGLL